MIFTKQETKAPKVWKLWEHQKGWGWDVRWSSWEHRRIVGHYPRRWDWQVGDELQAKMESGKIARFRITKFEPAEGVDDMFFLSVEDVGYLE